MKRASIYSVLILLCLIVGSCQSSEEAFTQDRSFDLCDGNINVCGFPAGCILDNNNYTDGSFPGGRTFAVKTGMADDVIRISVYFSDMVSTGTEFFVQAYEANCSLNPDLAQAHLLDVNIFNEAGDDQKLDFELTLAMPGEHAVQLFSDANTEYLLRVDI